jgi:hypothetical protein
MRERADGIADHNIAAIDNFLEFRDGFGALMCGEICQAAHIDRIEWPNKHGMYVLREGDHGAWRVEDRLHACVSLA